MAHRLQKRKVFENRHDGQRASEEGQSEETRTGQQPKAATKTMPRPILPSVDQYYIYDKQILKKNEPSFPPPESLYKSRTNYEVPPEMLRMTTPILLNVPKRISLPIAAWITPFGSERVHVVDVMAPIRCPRCKGHNNLYFKQDSTRRGAFCNLCSINFQIDQKSDPRNITTSEISTQAVLDYRVQEPFYFKKETKIIKLIIAIEISMPIIETGVFVTVIESLKSIFLSHEFEACIRIGLVTYDEQGLSQFRVAKEVNWKEIQPVEFNVPNNKSQIYCNPLSDQDFLLDPRSESDKLEYLLDVINAKAKEYWEGKKFQNVANYIMAIKSLKDCFGNNTGRIVLFSLLDPKNTATCAIRQRTEEENKFPLKPIHSDFKQLAKELLDRAIGIDHFLFSKQHLVSHELPTTHFLCSSTGGKLNLYSVYENNEHSEHLHYSIYRLLCKPYVYDVNFTCRLSEGLNVIRFGCADGFHETRDVVLSVMESSASFTIEIEHEEKIDENNASYLQFALMYTTGSGQRLIRVINYKFEVTAKLERVYEACDYLTFANILCRNYVSKVMRMDPLKVRDEAIKELAGWLLQYKDKYPGWQSNKYSELAVPESLANSLAYLNSILNSRLFIQCSKVSADNRIQEILRINSYNFYAFAMRYYPKMYPLTLDIYDHEPHPGNTIEDEDQSEELAAVLPRNIPLTIQWINADGVYLYCSSDSLTIMVQPEADRQLLTDLFGTFEWEAIESEGLPELQSPHNIRVRLIIDQLRRRTSQYGGMFLPLRVITPRRKGPYKEQLMQMLKEDFPECTYHTFLDSIHQCMQTISK